MTTVRNRGLRPWRSCGEGAGTVGCQPSEWMVAVAEQRDETGGGGGGVDSRTIETIGNRVRVRLGSL